ncbi:MAG: hypothetical protein ACOY30_00360 [Bacillota bacterium]
MADKKKHEQTLTESGHQYDKELARVSVKVSPALQAVIANQHELIDLIEKNHPEVRIFVDQHRTELLTVEEQIASAFGQYRKKRDAAKAQRQVKREIAASGPDLSMEDSAAPKRAGGGRDVSGPDYTDCDMKLPVDEIDVMADRISPGLPSQRYGERPAPAPRSEVADVRRLAIGASIKALSGFLGRDLTEEEIAAIERQVDSYL